MVTPLQRKSPLFQYREHTPVATAAEMAGSLMQNPWQPNVGGTSAMNDRYSAMAASRQQQAAANDRLRNAYTAMGQAAPAFGTVAAARSGNVPGFQGTVEQAMPWQQWVNSAVNERNQIVGGVSPQQQVLPWVGGSGLDRPSQWNSLLAKAPETAQAVSASANAGRDERTAGLLPAAMRRQLVTMRAQGRRLDPARAAVELALANNQPMSDELMTAMNPYAAGMRMRTRADEAVGRFNMQGQIGAAAEQARGAVGVSENEARAMREAAIQRRLGEESVAETTGRYGLEGKQAEAEAAKYGGRAQALGYLLGNRTETDTPETIIKAAQAYNAAMPPLEQASHAGLSVGPSVIAGQPAVPSVDPFASLLSSNRGGLFGSLPPAVAQQANAYVAANDPEGLSSFLQLNTNLTESEINKVLRSVTGERSAHVGAPGGEHFELLNQYLRAIGLMKPVAGQKYGWGGATIVD